MLHDAARFTPTANSSAEASIVHQALTALQPQLAPLLALQIPVKQKQSKKQKGKEQQQAADSEGQASEPQMTLLAGPLTKLPEPLQAVGVDILYHLPGKEHPALLKSSADDDNTPDDHDCGLMCRGP
jgi:hypothetical protein